MVKFYHWKDIFDEEWTVMTQALWNRYPNPHCKHVLTLDTLSRSVDPFTGELRSERLFMKSGTVPHWLKAMIPFKRGEAFVVESSTVDGINKSLRTVTRNINMRRLLYVEEECIYTPKNPDQTQLQLRAQFHCQLRYVGGSLEGFGLSNFVENVQRSRLAWRWVLSELKRQQRQKIN